MQDEQSRNVPFGCNFTVLTQSDIINGYHILEFPDTSYIRGDEYNQVYWQLWRSPWTVTCKKRSHSWMTGEGETVSSGSEFIYLESRF